MTTLNEEKNKCTVCDDPGPRENDIPDYCENKERPLISDLNEAVKCLYLTSIEKEYHLVTERDTEFRVSDIDSTIESKSSPTSRNQESSRTLDE